MPELPEVETIKNALTKAIKGAEILHTDVYCRRFRMPIAENFENLIQGAKIFRLKRIAKYMILDLDNGKSIIWHLGMSGRVKICANESVELAKHDHVVFHTTKGIVIFNDARRFGMLSAVPTDRLREQPYLKRIGIDPLSDDFNAQYLFKLLQNKTIAIKLALLDQTLIAGIGNIYASEALYSAQILPTRPAQSLSLSECRVLVESIKNVLNQAIKAGGSTLKDYRRPDGSMGYFQNSHCVYNKTGKACPDCCCDLSQSKGIRKIVLGGRSTFYCPVRQK